MQYLQTMPGWWRDVLDAKYESSDGSEHRLLIAVRDNYLSVYANGRTVYEIRFVIAKDRIEPRCRIHRRYVLGRTAEAGYLTFDGVRFLGAGEQIGISYVGKQTLEGWITNAVKNHTRLERAGVGSIAARHPNAIDVELALPPNGPAVPDARPGPPQMNIACLERSNDGVRLAFYEAKLFNNPELRANKDLKPQVMTQLGTYKNYISERRADMIEAYRNACGILQAIAEMRGTEVSCLVREVARNPQLLIDLDPKPRLIVFGYTANQVGPGSSWVENGHEQALRGSGYKLLMSERPEDVPLRSCHNKAEDLSHTPPPNACSNPAAGQGTDDSQSVRSSFDDEAAALLAYMEGQDVVDDMLAAAAFYKCMGL